MVLGNFSFTRLSPLKNAEKKIKKAQNGIRKNDGK